MNQLSFQFMQATEDIQARHKIIIHLEGTSNP